MFQSQQNGDSVSKCKVPYDHKMFYNDHILIPKSKNCNVVFCEISYLPGGKISRRIQSGLQMVQIFKGHLHLKGEDQTWDVKEGQAILLTPGKEEMFYFSPDQPTHHGWSTWSFSGEGHGAEEVAKAYPECGSVIQMDLNYLNLFKTGLELARSGATARQMNALFVALLEEHLKAPSGEKLDPRVQKAMNVIRSEDLSFLSPESLARKVHQSLPHLNRLFKQALDTTPSQVIWEQRFENASRLLLDTALGIEEIGQRSGMPNPSHFCKRFRARFGVTPLQFRKKNWERSFSD